MFLPAISQHLPECGSSFLGAMLITAIMISLGHAFYNLYLHPLRHFPGPRLYASSRLPYAIGLCRGTINKTVAEAHKKYGEVIRIAPDELSFISADTAWSDIYGFRGAKRPEFGKDPLWYPTQPNGTRNLLSSTREDHSRIRRVFSQGFSDKALRNQESLIQGYIDKLMQRLLEKKNSSVDLVRYFNYTTFDIIADLTFGESFGCLDSDDYHDFIPAILGALRVVNILQAINYYGTINKIASVFLALLSKISTPVHILFHNFVAGKVDKRLAMEMQRPDFITAVMNQTEEKGGLTEEELKSNSVLFLIAGSETTATMMSGTTFALLKHPEAMKKLCYEIRTVFHSEDEITFESASRLPYLQAVIHEGLRMYPPVPTGFARRVPKNGETVSGYYLPENTSVYVSQYAAYHDTRNFTNPDQFLPERWLDDPKYEGDKRSVFMPFSNGPRNCMGKNLAYAEMRCILARIFFKFDMELVDENVDWFDQKVFQLWEKEPLMVKLSDASK